MDFPSGRIASAEVSRHCSSFHCRDRFRLTPICSGHIPVNDSADTSPALTDLPLRSIDK
jgi:hypothetical protein